jgi:phenylacetate-CoA ligase
MKSIPPLELASTSTILDSQMKALSATLRYVLLHSPFYKNNLSKVSINYDQLSPADFQKLPTTSKDDLQNYNWDFLCVEKAKVVEYTSTSGTLGKPVTIALTANDLHRLAYNESISFACADGSEKDLFQLMLTLDRQFMAGIAYYEGIRKLGAGIIRVGPGLPALQWDTIQRLQPSTLVAVPSFIVKLIAYAEEKGIDLNSSSVSKAICIGEGVRTESLQLNKLGTRIKDAWNIRLYSTYASTANSVH